MSDRDALFRAVCESPDDDTPRLVFADWLEENGDLERAEFIRLQVRLAPSDAPRWDDPEGSARMNQLERAHGEAWRAELPKVDGAGFCSWFKRGFVDTLAVKDVGALVAHAAELFAAAPVHTVIFDGLNKEQAAAVAAVPELARVRGLRFDRPARLGAPALRRLAASPHLAGLKELDLYDLPLSLALFRALAQAPWRLEVLRLGCEYAGPAWPAALLASAAVERLRVLNLEDRRVRLAAARALAGNPRLARVESLCLSGCELSNFCAVALAGAGHLTSLKDLVLSRNSLSPEGAQALADAPWFGGLRQLDLGFNPICPAGARALAGASRLPALRGLNLSSCWLDPASVVALAESPMLDEVRVLNLGSNDVGVEGAQALARAGRLAKVRLLYVDRRKLPEAEQRLLEERFGKGTVI